MEGIRQNFGKTEFGLSGSGSSLKKAFKVHCSFSVVFFSFFLFWVITWNFWAQIENKINMLTIRQKSEVEIEHRDTEIDVICNVILLALDTMK